MQWYKQSTAASLVVGPILDSSGVEYASAVIGDLSLSKNGGTLTALASAATLTYIANGYYTLALTTGNTDTLGRGQITCNKSTYQMPPRELMVLPATVYDALVTNATNTTGGLPAATGAISALAGAVSTLTQSQVTGGAYALNSSSFAYNAALDFTAAQKAATLARVTLADTLTTYTGNTPQTGDAYARIGGTGSGLTSLAQASVWTATVAGRIDVATSTRLAPTTTGRTLDVGVNHSAPANIVQVTGVDASSGASGFLRVSVACGYSQGNDADYPLADPLDATTYHLESSLTAAGVWAATPRTLTSAANITSTGGTTVPQTGDAYGRIGAAGAGLTAVGDTRMANLDAAVSTRSTFAGGAVASVTGNVGGNVTGSVGSVVSAVVLPANPPAGFLVSASFAAGATVPRVTLVDTTTANTDMRGTNNALLAASYVVPPTVGQIGAQVTSDHGTGSYVFSPTTVPPIPAATAVADAVLARNLAGGSDGGRTVAQALAAARNKVAFDVPTAGQFTVYGTDDATPLWVGTYSRGGNTLGPLTAVDPA